MHGFCMRRDMHLWWQECLPDCGEDTFQLHLTGKPSAGPRGHTAAPSLAGSPLPLNGLHERTSQERNGGPTAVDKYLSFEVNIYV